VEVHEVDRQFDVGKALSMTAIVLSIAFIFSLTLM
jgi:hypothetical protein